ncbi:hypothetical protein ACQ859_20350 [Roseateles chitinivorans]|uniref:hypothetical protein n=1 Tax=Roseateles chitinivorans TaxID=2917965 RepID=UPI003D66F365
MNDGTSPNEGTVPCMWRDGAFFDLLADAAFQHKQAANASKLDDEGYASQRFARAAILAAALSVESAANCLLETLDIPKTLRSEVDRMTPLGKIDACLRLRGHSSIAYGIREVQQIAELVKIRNDHVHPRTSTIPAELGSEKVGDTHSFVPISLESELWPSLGISKRSMFWSHQSSQAVLKAVSGFHKYVLKTLMGLKADEMKRILASRLEVSTMQLHLVSDDVLKELEGAREWGADLQFFGVFLPPESAPISTSASPKIGMKGGENGRQKIVWLRAPRNEENRS